MRRNQNGEALEKGHFQAEEIAGYESPMGSKSSALPPTKDHNRCRCRVSSVRLARARSHRASGPGW